MSEEPLPRSEWEMWRTEVYEYRQGQFEKELAQIMAVINRLDTVVTKGQAASEAMERLARNLWVRIGVALVLVAPVLNIAIQHFWR